VKVSSLLVELKANSVMVELDATENSVCSEYGVIAKFIVLLAHTKILLQLQLNDFYEPSNLGS
jgi:hypothetical protein